MKAIVGMDMNYIMGRSEPEKVQLNIIHRAIIACQWEPTMTLHEICIVSSIVSSFNFCQPNMDNIFRHHISVHGVHPNYWSVYHYNSLIAMKIADESFISSNLFFYSFSAPFHHFVMNLFLSSRNKKDFVL